MKLIELDVRGTSSSSEPIHYRITIGGDGLTGRIMDEEATFDGEKLFCMPAGRGDPMPVLSLIQDDFDIRVRPFIEALSTQLVCFRPEVLAEPCELDAARHGFLAQGYGLAAVIDALLTGPDRSAIQRLEEQLHRVVPTIRGVSLVTTELADDEGARTGKALEFVLAGGDQGAIVTIPADQASQGVILAAGYLALVYSNTAQCLLIEEPENGLHPSALGFIVELLQKVSRGEIGPGPRQVVLTTHSPLLLNFVDPDDVLIVTRGDDNVQVTPMIETPHFAERFQDFDLGELWYNVGEDSLVNKS